MDGLIGCPAFCGHTSYLSYLSTLRLQFSTTLPSGGVQQFSGLVWLLQDRTTGWNQIDVAQHPRRHSRTEEPLGYWRASLYPGARASVQQSLLQRFPRPRLCSFRGCGRASKPLYHEIQRWRPEREVYGSLWPRQEFQCSTTASMAATPCLALLLCVSTLFSSPTASSSRWSPTLLGRPRSLLSARLAAPPDFGSLEFLLWAPFRRIGAGSPLMVGMR
jgi:hypothetical protein